MFGHLIPIKLPSVAWAAGQDATTSLAELAKKKFGRLLHLVGFEFAVVMTPTFTTAPTTVGMNNLVARAVVSDGKINRFEGGFNHMRLKERLGFGRVRVPDADTDTASGTARYFRRLLTLGPDNFIGWPTDFLMPTGLLENGEIQWKFGGLTDISADCTANVAQITVTAWCVLLDELRIPPAHVFRATNVNAQDVALQGRSAYDCIALLNSSAFDAIAANDFGSFTVNLGEGETIPTVRGEDIAAAYQYFMGVGEIGGFMGEPEGASDDNHKIVNRSSPAAVGAGPNDCQVVLFSGPRARISKLPISGSVVKVAWDGAQASAHIVTSRILPQEEASVSERIDAALGKMKMKSVPRLKTLSKLAYKGPHVDFMPWVVKVA